MQQQHKFTHVTSTMHMHPGAGDALTTTQSCNQQYSRRALAPRTAAYSATAASRASRNARRHGSARAAAWRVVAAPCFAIQSTMSMRTV
eukprot:scaffold96424_cov54-Phaeocystis_antarctica.AAC.1